jgi:hypothetical protein
MPAEEGRRPIVVLVRLQKISSIVLEVGSGNIGRERVVTCGLLSFWVVEGERVIYFECIWLAIVFLFFVVMVMIVFFFVECLAEAN